MTEENVQPNEEVEVTEAVEPTPAPEPEPKTKKAVKTGVIEGDRVRVKDTVTTYKKLVGTVTAEAKGSDKVAVMLDIARYPREIVFEQNELIKDG